MPLYEYKCGACGHSFERIVKFSDPPLKTCPQCGAEAVHQVIHAPAVQFKGSGWYVSDYARKSSTPAAAKKAGSDSASASAESGTKESSSASSTEKTGSSDSAKPSTGESK